MHCLRESISSLSSRPVSDSACRHIFLRPCSALPFWCQNHSHIPSSNSIRREFSTSGFDFSNSSSKTIPRFPDIRDRKLFSGLPTSHPIYGAFGPNKSVSYLVSVMSTVCISRERRLPSRLPNSVFPCPLGPTDISQLSGYPTADATVSHYRQTSIPKASCLVQQDSSKAVL
jgi:hypothetical protein